MRGCAARGETEQASQSKQCLAVGAHLAFGVLEGLVLIGTTRLEHAAVPQASAALILAGARPLSDSGSGMSHQEQDAPHPPPS